MRFWSHSGSRKEARNIVRLHDIQASVHCDIGVFRVSAETIEFVSSSLMYYYCLIGG